MFLHYWDSSSGDGYSLDEDFPSKITDIYKANRWMGKQCESHVPIVATWTMDDGTKIAKIERDPDSQGGIVGILVLSKTQKAGQNIMDRLGLGEPSDDLEDEALDKWYDNQTEVDPGKIFELAEDED